MAYYNTEPLGGSNDVVVSVYNNTGEYVGISLLTDINGGCYPTRTEMILFESVWVIRSGVIEIAK